MLLAGTPKSWEIGPPDSALRVLVVFAGIPLLVIAVIFLLAYAPSWVKGSRSAQSAGGSTEWFGVTPAAETDGVPTASRAQSRVDVGPGSGGASGTW